MIHIHHGSVQSSFTALKVIYASIYPFLPPISVIALAKNSSKMVKRSVERGHAWFILDLSGKASGF